jgi:hypothetical protein
MTPTPQDVAMLIGLPIDSFSVIGCGRLIDKDDICNCLLGQVSVTNAYRGYNIKLTWLETNFKTSQWTCHKINWLYMLEHI